VPARLARVDPARIAVREARELVRMVLAGEADPATWTPRAKRLLGIK
jgi:hypothetical protein